MAKRMVYESSLWWANDEADETLKHLHIGPLKLYAGEGLGIAINNPSTESALEAILYYKETFYNHEVAVATCVVNEPSTGETAGACTVVNTGTGGTGFAATAIVNGSGVVTGCTITNYGSGYYTAPTVTRGSATFTVTLAAPAHKTLSNYVLSPYSATVAAANDTNSLGLIVAGQTLVLPHPVIGEEMLLTLRNKTVIGAAGEFAATVKVYAYK